MATGVLKRITFGVVPFIVLLLLLVSLHWMSDATQNSASSKEIYSSLLLFNAIGLVVLLGLIGANLYKLVQEYRTGAPGARLTLRMVVLFVSLAVAPVSVVYYYSLQMLHRGIDSWFDVQIDQAMEDVLQLSRASLDLQMRERLKLTESMLRQLRQIPQSLLAISVDEQRTEYDALELTLLGKNAQIIATSSASHSMLVPNRPGEDILLQLRRGNNYVGLDPIRDEGLHIRVVVKTAEGTPLILQALFPLPEHMSTLAVAVQEAYARYKELAYLRQALKYSFTLTLSLVLLFSLLSAIWAAFFSTRRMTAPIRALVEGTQAVAHGDYDKRLPLARKDELGFLVSSFNDMTRRLAQARDEAARSQRQEKEQRAYLEAVLGSLSSGVLTFDCDRKLRTANRVAAEILDVELLPLLGDSLASIAEKQPGLAPFITALDAHLTREDRMIPEQTTLSTAGRRKVLMFRSKPLSSADGLQTGHVVVFDDVTALIQAQRDAAWGEVARRLAHEIKNPLTPIQLSAERLRHKYLKIMGQEDAQVLERSTITIIQQVEAMKEMVNAFSEYARPPQMKPESLDINQLLQGVLDLYRNTPNGVEIHTQLDENAPPIEADPGKLRQVFHNLVKNALESMQDTPNACLTVFTRCRGDHTGPYVEIEVRDNGPGFSEDIQGKVFEPYVTTKPKGTGLGLAIVKKIVEEHGGTVWAENPAGGGGSIVLHLPALSVKAAYQGTSR